VYPFEGTHSVGCTTFDPTALSHVMTFEVLHNKCCDLRLDSEFRFHHEPSCMSTRCDRQSTEGYTHDDRLIGRGTHDHESNGNRDTRHKIYIVLGRQHNVKPYIMCSHGLVDWRRFA
jgi:hypothetical protein